MPYKKIAFFTIIIILLLTINDLTHSLYSIWQKQDLIIQAQKNLAAEKKENKELKKEIAQVNQPQFVETQARDKLLLAKPGEGIVILPKDQFAASSSASQKSVDTRPNWKKWWDVFFNS
ncbi:MAG TPA: septum formation initiator family protein [Candidatus Acidoferrales bacterium]|nr:septum formation initiator family protein [Candidatus Acidoferrales bacterium]